MPWWNLWLYADSSNWALMVWFFTVPVITLAELRFVLCSRGGLGFSRFSWYFECFFSAICLVFYNLEGMMLQWHVDWKTYQNKCMLCFKKSWNLDDFSWTQSCNEKKRTPSNQRKKKLDGFTLMSSVFFPKQDFRGYILLPNAILPKVLRMMIPWNLNMLCFWSFAFLTLFNM